MNRPRRAVVAASLSAALLMAGCGSDTNEPTTTSSWADGVCSSINTWKTSVVAAAGSAVSGGLDKQSLQSATDKARSATETLEGELKDLGKPDTASGDQVQGTVDQLTTQLKSGVDSITSSVDGVSGVGGVATAVSSIRSTLGTMQSQVTTAVAKLKEVDAGGELTTAFQQSSACQQLTTPTPTPT